MTSVLAWAVALAAGAPVAMLAAECLVGAGALARRHAGSVIAPPFVVVMPAHDEAAGIEAAVRSAMAQLRACDELLVVADNCTDDTAQRAEALGATVIERDEPGVRGKGHALQFARAFLAEHRPGMRAVVVLDADCRTSSGALPALANTAVHRGAAVQGVFLLDPPGDAGPVVRVSAFAFLIKNLVRQQGLERLSGAALLHGSGMAFPYAMFLEMRWHGSSLVEDLEMGLDLLLAGNRVVTEPSAQILSGTSSPEGTAGQRLRWEHGTMHTAGRYIPRLVGRAVAQPRGEGWRLGIVALDLMVPPTVLLALISGMALLIVLLLSGLSTPFLFLCAVQAVAAGSLLRAWWLHGDDVLPLRDLRELPGYVLWKLPLIARFFTARQRRWVRTERTGSGQ